MSDADPTVPREYRLAPIMVARLVGGYLLVLAVVVFAATALVAVAGWSGDVLVVLLGVGLVGLFAGAAWLRSRAYVVRLDDEGYRVRLVRGVGATHAGWGEVREAVTAHPNDLPCLVLRLKDGRSTTIPVGVLADDREEFAAEVIRRLRRAGERRA